MNLRLMCWENFREGNPPTELRFIDYSRPVEDRELVWLYI